MTETRWVAAAPFRAHLLHVCAASATPWPVVALHAGLPIALVRDLLDTRPGRRVLRIAPELARQVLDVSTDSIRQLRTRATPARTARHHLRRLCQAGWTRPAVARHLRVAACELDALAAGGLPEVPTLLELRLAALVAATQYAARRVPQAA